MLEQAQTRFRNIVLDGMDREYIKEQVVDESVDARMKRLVDEFIRKINKQFDNKRIIEICKRLGISVWRQTNVKWTHELFKFGIKLDKSIDYKMLKPILVRRLNSNVLTIKNFKQDSLAGLAKVLYSGFEQGKTYKTIGSEITKKYGIDKRRAARIAREETKNTNTALTKTRMKEYGVEYAFWRTAGDERVRPAGDVKRHSGTGQDHRRFDGKKYKIGIGLKNTNGAYEEPGDAFGCRCVGEPII